MRACPWTFGILCYGERRPAVVLSIWDFWSSVSSPDTLSVNYAPASGGDVENLVAKGACSSLTRTSQMNPHCFARWNKAEASSKEQAPAEEVWTLAVNLSREQKSRRSAAGRTKDQISAEMGQGKKIFIYKKNLLCSSHTSCQGIREGTVKSRTTFFRAVCSAWLIEKNAGHKCITSIIHICCAFRAYTKVNRHTYTAGNTAAVHSFPYWPGTNSEHLWREMWGFHWSEQHRGRAFLLR